MANARTSCECMRREVDWTHLPADEWSMDAFEVLVVLMWEN